MVTITPSDHSRYAELHPDLRRVCDALWLANVSFHIACGHRGRIDQEHAYAIKTSRAHFGQSPHNFKPSRAMDLVPFPLDWKDIASFVSLRNKVQKAAISVNVAISSGADWPTFKDYLHHELAGWRTMHGDPA